MINEVEVTSLDKRFNNLSSDIKDVAYFFFGSSR